MKSIGYLICLSAVLFGCSPEAAEETGPESQQNSPLRVVDLRRWVEGALCLRSNPQWILVRILKSLKRMPPHGQ